MCLISGHIRDNFFHVFPDHILQDNGTNVVFAALVLVGTVSGTDKEVLSLLKVVGGGIVELLLAIGTEPQTLQRFFQNRLRSCGAEHHSILESEMRIFRIPS